MLSLSGSLRGGGNAWHTLEGGGFLFVASSVTESSVPSVKRGEGKVVCQSVSSAYHCFKGRSLARKGARCVGKGREKEREALSRRGGTCLLISWGEGGESLRETVSAVGGRRESSILVVQLLFRRKGKGKNTHRGLREKS